jgi:hypothetical protein
LETQVYVGPTEPIYRHVPSGHQTGQWNNSDLLEDFPLKPSFSGPEISEIPTEVQILKFPRILGENG